MELADLERRVATLESQKRGFSQSAWMDYLLLNKGDALPTASIDIRGMICVFRGTPDVFYLCRLAADGVTYEWARSVMSSDLIPASSIDPSTDLVVTNLQVTGDIRAGSDGTPTITTQTAAGTTAALSSVTGGDGHGGFTLTPGGSGITTGAQVLITFQTPPGFTYDVIFMPRNANAALIHPHTGTLAGSSAQLSFATAPSSGQAYGFSYWIVGR